MVLADSNRLIRIGLDVILSNEADIDVIGEAEDESQLLEIVNHRDVDVVLMDFTAPSFSIETVPNVLERNANVRVVAITPDQEGETIVNALKAGVKSLELEILNHKSFIISEFRPIRYMLRFNGPIFMNLQFRGFTPFLRTRPFILSFTHS